MTEALASFAAPGVFQHIAAILAALFIVLGALPLIAAAVFALGGFAIAMLLAAAILMISLAVRMVKRKRARSGRDPYADPFGDVPHRGQK